MLTLAEAEEGSKVRQVHTACTLSVEGKPPNRHAQLRLVCDQNTPPPYWGE